MSRELNPFQLQAVRHSSGPLLVIAGAGSGKTTVITHKINHLIVDLGYTPDAILALTFTNKAAAEMRERVMAMIPQCNVAPLVSTFHAFSALVLRTHFSRLGGSNQFAIIDVQEQTKLIKSIVTQLGITDTKYRPQYIISVLGNLKNKLVGPRRYAAQSQSRDFDPEISKIYLMYQQQLWQNQAVDFSDLLFYMSTLFAHHPDVLENYQNQFKYILVDEYQDTNHAQYMLIKQLCGDHPQLTVVGDFDQNIYSWRGANIQNILRFETDYRNATVIKLEENYRSTQHILNAANAVIKNNKNRKDKTLWTHNDTGEKLRVFWGNDEHAEVRFVRDRISELHRSGIAYRDMVILFRINALSRVYEESLSQSRIPFKIVGGVAFFQRKEIKDLMAYLRLILNPNDTIAFMRVANVPPRQIGETTLTQLQQQAQEKQCSISDLVASDALSISSRGRANVLAFMQLIDSLATLYEQLTTDRIGLILKAIIEKTGYKAMLTQSSNPQDQERLENILQFISIAREEELSLSAFITKLSLATELESNADATTDAVTLMTMHHAKGLEFDTVFVVGMEEGILPHYRALNEPDEMEEERRLCYVALTRGKARVHVSGAQQRNVFGEPRFQKQSRFIKEMPNACCTFSGVQAVQGGGKSVSKWGESGAKVAPRAYPEIESVKVFAVGQAVLHAAWGQGVVSRVDGVGADAVIYVQFSGQLKKLLARYAPLVPVSATSTGE